MEGGAIDPAQPEHARPESPAVRAVAGRSAAIVAVVTWGLGPVMVKHIELPGLGVALYRMWFGAAIAVAILLLKGGRLSMRTFRYSFAGGLTFAVNIAFFFVAVKHTTVTDATIITALQPALLLFVAASRFGEIVTARTVWWTLVAIAGVVVVVVASDATGERTAFGDLLAAGALATWAWYFVVSKEARTRLGAVEYLAGLSIVAAIALVPAVLLLERSPGVPTGATVWWLLLLAVGPGGGHLLMNWAHAHVPITVASLLTLVTPLIAAVSAAIVVDEPVLPLQLVGMLIVLVSLVPVVWRPAGYVAASASSTERT